MTGFLPETPGVIEMEDVAEIRRLHFIEQVTVSELAKQFKLSRPTIRQHQPYSKLGDYLERLNHWLEA